MIRLDSTDVEILFSMYEHAPDFYQIAWEMQVYQKDDTRKRLYRLSRHGLCAGDTPGMHPGQPLCWSLSPEGERVVEECDETGYWHLKDDFVYKYSRPRKGSKAK